ncbi:unnamed protein product [Amoebophrya sp. A120]|nr:unnamed protein product [Amoebophrya sp. A120]|eukprot:GSA120T00009972001.1
MVLSFMISKKLIAGLFLALAGGFLTTSATAFRIRMDVVNKQQYRLSTTESEHTNVAVTTTKKLGLWESVMTAIGAKQRPLCTANMLSLVGRFFLLCGFDDVMLRSSLERMLFFILL